MKITKLQLRNIIQEVLDEVEFHGETPAGQLYDTEEEDARFSMQLAAEKVMKRAGLDQGEMNYTFKAMKGNSVEADEFWDSSAHQKLYDFLDVPYEIDSQSMGAEMTPDQWILDYLQNVPEEGSGTTPTPERVAKNPPQYGGWDPFNTGRSSRRPPGPGRSRFRRESLTREKITKKELQKIIKEELENFLETNESPSREECEGLLGASGGYKPENPRELETMQRCKDTHPDLGKGKRE